MTLTPFSCSQCGNRVSVRSSAVPVCHGPETARHRPLAMVPAPVEQLVLG